VGYTTKSSGDQFNFLMVPFTDIGYNTSDIQQIGISDDNAGTIGWGTETFEVWAGAPTVVQGSGFVYYDPSMDVSGESKTYYWGDDAGTPVAFSIARGQGVVINTPADLTFTTPGEVNTNEVSFTTGAQFNFTGNPFPTVIDIQKISISDDNAGTIGWGTETFEVWEGSPSVVAGSGFVYFDPSMDISGESKTYYWGDDSGTPVSYSIAPNQGVVINCPEGLTVSIKY